ncbi:MAG: type III pantothenate kinase [Chlamydiae bacterium]|nr:type III pantothenate kinase [Chlamydiota bacterium]MBI3266920.1 type III pantothenate kinase [Chlamydiota bacterium]
MSGKIVVVDIGNTNIVMGVFKGDAVVDFWRIATVKKDEVYYLKNLPDGLKEQKEIKGVVIATVVPELKEVFESLCEKLFSVKPVCVSSDLNIDLKIWYKNPRQVGADRIANAIAARKLYGTPAIVVDFGTAVTFDIISFGGEYLGGVILPGMGLSRDILHERTALLPWVNIIKPNEVLGRDTISAIQSGIYWGFVGMVKFLLKRLKAEVFPGYEMDVKVIATGGYVSYFLSDIEEVHHFDSNLTIKGLKAIYDILEEKKEDQNGERKI